jgi:hypothetical protein
LAFCKFFSDFALPEIRLFIDGSGTWRLARRVYFQRRKPGRPSLPESFSPASLKRVAFCLRHALQNKREELKIDMHAF